MEIGVDVIRYATKFSRSSHAPSKNITVTVTLLLLLTFMLQLLLLTFTLLLLFMSEDIELNPDLLKLILVKNFLSATGI